jgi:hypothetical protein
MNEYPSSDKFVEYREGKKTSERAMGNILLGRGLD